jgi:hypothetical protein
MNPSPWGSGVGGGDVDDRHDAIRAAPAELALTAHGCVIVTVDCHERQTRGLRFLQRAVAGAPPPAPGFGFGGAKDSVAFSLAPADDERHRLGAIVQPI